MPTIQQARVQSATGGLVFVGKQGGTELSSSNAASGASSLSLSIITPTNGIALYDSVSQNGDAITLALRNLVAGPNVTITENDGLILIGVINAEATQFYDIIGYWRGLLPLDAFAIHYLEMVRPISLHSGLVGSIASCLVAPTGSVSLALKKNGSSIGTINFASSSTTGTFSFAATVSFVPGDVWEVDPPSPQDATFAGLSWTIVATVR